jgi:hypothetical protein
MPPDGVLGGYSLGYSLRYSKGYAPRWGTRRVLTRMPSASWRGKCYVIRASPSPENPSLNQLPVWQTFEYDPQVLIPCPPAVPARASGGREPSAVRQSLPAFESGYACGRKHSAAGVWTRVLSSNDMARPFIIAHKLTVPRLWVGSDRPAEFAKSKQTES